MITLGAQSFELEFDHQSKFNLDKFVFFYK